MLGRQENLKLAKGLLALLAGAAIGCAKQSNTGETNSSLPDLSTVNSGIINGSLVSEGSELQQSTVGLYMIKGEGGSTCTGSILSEDVILTAAHCISDSPEQVLVFFTTDMEKATEAQIRPAVTYLINDLWNKTPQDPAGRGDIALIKFAGGLPKGFIPAKLISPDFKLAAGMKTINVGFGISDTETKTGSGILRHTEVEILGSVSPTEVASDEHVSGVCFGDSGGPALIRSGTDLILWGVASYVTGKDEKESCHAYEVHTNIQPYLEWIEAARKALHEAKAEDSSIATTPPSAPSTPVKPDMAPVAIPAKL